MLLVRIGSNYPELPRIKGWACEGIDIRLRTRLRRDRKLADKVGGDRHILLFTREPLAFIRLFHCFTREPTREQMAAPVNLKAEPFNRRERRAQRESPLSRLVTVAGHSFFPPGTHEKTPVDPYHPCQTNGTKGF